MNRVILVTAIGGDVGHSVLKCLLGTGAKLIGCDMNPYPAGMDLVAENFVSLSASDNKYTTHLLGLCARYHVTHLIPISEPEIEVISRCIDSFNNMNIKVCINNADIVQCCLDKYATAEKLRGLGLMVPDYCTPEDYVTTDKPYIVKLRHSYGSKLLRVITTRKELDELSTHTFAPLVLQEYIDESEGEYTVGVFRDSREVRVIAFRRKLQGGFTKFVELSNDASIVHDAKTVATGLGLVGCLNIQLRKRNGINYIFEINPRLSGTVHFRHLLGFNDVLWWLDVLDQKELSEYTCNYRVAIGVREMNEKFLVLDRMG